MAKKRVCVRKKIGPSGEKRCAKFKEVGGKKGKKGKKGKGRKKVCRTAKGQFKKCR